MSRIRSLVLQRIPDERDLSVQVAETVHAGIIADDIQRLGGDLLTHVEVFDLFQGGKVPKGRKNLAFRMIYQSLDRTLVSDEVQQIHTKIAAEIAKKYQAAFQS